MDYFYSPLRYPGGKGKVAHYFKQLFADNLLFDAVYIEPYAGGASVGLSLLFSEYASKIVINDVDRSIFAFWHSVLNRTDDLCRLIKDTSVNIKNWEAQKEIQKSKSRNRLLDLGFSTFFLNRTNRSGIINAGIIGGRNQAGKWKMDARFNKNDLIARIERIALYKSKIEIYNLDAVELIKNLQKGLPKKNLFYFDPPYYIKGKDLYLNYYGDKDHQEIANEVKKLKKNNWIVTYDNVDRIKNLYSNFRQITYSLNYSAGQRSKGKEVMIFSNNLHISNHSSIK